MSEDIFVTGIGLNTPLGEGWKEHLNAWESGSHAFGPLQQVDTRDALVQYGGEIGDLFKREVPNRKLRKLVSRKDYLGVATAKQAIDHAGLDFKNHDPYRIGVFVGSCSTQLSDFHPFFPNVIDCIDQESNFFDSARFGSEAIHNVNPITAVKVLMNGALAHISQTFGIKGPNSNFMDYEVAGHLALENGFHALRNDLCDVCIVGAISTPIDPFQLTDPHMQYDILESKGKSLDQAYEEYQPGQETSKGRIVSEGSVFLVLEKSRRSTSRQTPPFAKIKAAHSSSLGQSLPLKKKTYASVAKCLQQIGATGSVAASYNGSPRYDTILKDSIPEDVKSHSFLKQSGDLLECNSLYSLVRAITTTETHTTLCMNRFGVSGAIKFQSLWEGE